MSGKLRSIDARALRTRNSVARAVIRIGRERGVDRLTVRELAREAGISRSTFYAHFGGLDDYLCRSFANMLERMAEHGAVQAGPDQTKLLHVEGILAHVAASGGYASAIAHSRHRPAMLAAGEDRLKLHLERRLALLRPALPPPDRAAAARFVAAGFIGLLHEWMAAGLRRPAEEVQRQFDAIVARL